MSTSNPAIDRLWDQWTQDKDNEIANQLVEHYLYLVHYHAQRIAIHLPKNVEKDDIKSLGLFGLYDALHKFDPKRDLKFDTYASFRIRGAIIDGLRKEDWLPRSTRDKTKKIEQAIHILEQQLHRAPTSTEIATYLNLKKREVEEIIKDSLFSNLLSLEEKAGDNNEDHKEGIGYSIPDQRNPSPEDKVLSTERVLELVNSIQQLNENEQMVISLFYKEELTFTEIGQILELTTSRISQIHKQAIFKLKKALTLTV
ncbi:RNA polymerase sigma-D factor [Paraliobacillus ryukyuensis]|uniref:RNA polymerase sigma-28 (SigD/FliA/WhiG) subunit n=1 Tax=Paraliobacillus ryukyuensis TaxID=200904 RepID=A0A366EK17_9BACI|nr:FliA/WhiG family RNA polymerase sigma factor [Paraliobacillus ryukyuensis]RBP01775.1 RNA polymerase sigma-28 (SigD/FliA/WhiG) subunit [Paraliobacillus ryukyuensis]